MATQPGTTPLGPQPLFNIQGVKWGWLMTLGVIMLILGSVAIIFPAVTAESFELVLGILLIIGGAGRIVSMFRSRGWGDFLMKLLVSAIYLAAGILLVLFPLGGTLTLTLLLGIFFVAMGLSNVLVALMEREMKGWVWMLFNGIVSFVLGALIWAEWPASAAWAIGLLVGIWLIFDGWAMIMLSWMMHKKEERPAAA